MVGTHGPQSRTHQAGYSDTPLCKWKEKAPGTQAHRHCRCEYSNEQRLTAFGQTGRNTNACDGDVWWARCFLLDPNQWIPKAIPVQPDLSCVSYGDKVGAVAITRPPEKCCGSDVSPTPAPASVSSRRKASRLCRGIHQS